jgi:hypothetical protein
MCKALGLIISPAGGKKRRERRKEGRKEGKGKTAYGKIPCRMAYKTIKFF